MDKIHTTIKLFAILREGRFDITTGEFPIGTIVNGVIKRIGIPENEVILICVNNRHGRRDKKLVDGDTIALFPPVGGG